MKYRTIQNLNSLPLEGKVSHEVGRMRWRAPFLCFSVRGSAFCPPHQPPCVPPVRRTGPSPQGEAFGDASFYDVPDFMEQQRSGEMRKHFSRTPLVYVGTEPCRAAFMVYCAQGLYVADNRGRIRKNSPTPGLHNIASADVQALGRWAWSRPLGPVFYLCQKIKLQAERGPLQPSP